MTNKKRIKLNKMLGSWIPGVIGVPKWLKVFGISPLLITWYLHSKWLTQIARGAYKRPGDVVDWTGGLFTIQQLLNLPIHLAAQSAIAMHGRGQNIRFGRDEVILFGLPKSSLPAWFANNNEWDINVNYHTTNLFAESELGLTDKDIHNYSIKISSLERAIMEVLHLVSTKDNLVEAYTLMENLPDLRPKLIQQLLENCHSIKVKRLFMILSEKINHPWIKYLDLENIDFGKGKRSITGGGIFYKKYNTAIPPLTTKGNL